MGAGILQGVANPHGWAVVTAVLALLAWSLAAAYEDERWKRLLAYGLALIFAILSGVLFSR